MPDVQVHGGGGGRDCMIFSTVQCQEVSTNFLRKFFFLMTSVLPQTFLRGFSKKSLFVAIPDDLFLNLLLVTLVYVTVIFRSSVLTEVFSMKTKLLLMK